MITHVKFYLTFILGKSNKYNNTTNYELVNSSMIQLIYLYVL